MANEQRPNKSALTNPFLLDVKVNGQPLQAALHPSSIYSAISTAVWQEMRHSNMPLITIPKAMVWRQLPPPPFPIASIAGISACELEFQDSAVTLDHVLIF